MDSYFGKLLIITQKRNYVKQKWAFFSMVSLIWQQLINYINIYYFFEALLLTKTLKEIIFIITVFFPENIKEKLKKLIFR